MKILWQGDAISCMKSFGTLKCSLCMRERLEILKKSQKEQDKLINTCGEIYGACRHKTRFHRYTQNINITSTDDGDTPERVPTTIDDVAADVDFIRESLNRTHINNSQSDTTETNICHIEVYFKFMTYQNTIVEIN